MDLPDNSSQARTGNGGIAIFVLFIILGIILPPVGIAAGLVYLATSDDTRSREIRNRRGMVLIILGIIAFLLQLVLGSIFVFPKAMEYLAEKFDGYDNPYSGYGRSNPHNYRSNNNPLSDDVTILTNYVYGRFGDVDILAEYEKATEEIEAGSTEPILRYTKAIFLMYSEETDNLIENREMRFAEIERLIAEGMSIDGEDPAEEAYLDVIMLTPLIQTQLEKDDIEEAEQLFQKLNDFELEGGRAYYLASLKLWAYNSFFEHWQIRDPGRGLDFAIQYIKDHVWEPALPPEYFYFDYYGGIGNLHTVATRLGREKEIYDLLDYVLEIVPEGRSLDDTEIATHYTFRAYLAARDRNWPETEDLLAKAIDVLPYVNDYHMPLAIARYRNGKRYEAAEMVFKLASKENQMFLMDEIRYLFADSPRDALDFLLGKIADNSEDEFVAANVAMLASQLGMDDLAETSFVLMRIIETREHKELALDMSRAIGAGKYDEALEISRSQVVSLLNLSAESAYVQARLQVPDASPDVAVVYLEEILVLDPTERDPDFPLFQTYFDLKRELNDEKGAIGFINTIIQLNQTKGYPKMFLAKMYRQDGEYEEAIKLLEEIKRTSELGGSLRNRSVSPLFKDTNYWYNLLNLIDYYQLDLEIAENYKLLGDRDMQKHHLYLADLEGREVFDVQYASFLFLLEEGKLKEAGEALDHLSFYRDIDDPESDAYVRLMKGYEMLRKKGWVNDRGFTPVLRRAS